MPRPYGRAPPAQTTNAHAQHSRDSNALRASVLDVFVQLGALQKNSLITEWMFEEEGGNGGSSMDQRGRRDYGREEGRHEYGYDTESAEQRTIFEEPRMDDRVQSPTSESETRKGRSKFSSKITAVFRSRSKSKTRAEKASRNATNPPAQPPLPPLLPIPSRVGAVAEYETDEGYNSSSPSTQSGKRSKSRRRGISAFPIKSRPSESSEVSSSRPSTPSEFSSRPSHDRSHATSPTSDASVPFPVLSPVSSGSQTDKKKRFGRAPRGNLAVDGRVSEERDQDEGWEQFPPLTPGAFSPQVLNGTQPNVDRSKTPTQEVGNKQDGGTLLKRLSFAIPRTTFQKPVKRKNTKRPPSLLPIMDPPAFEKDGASKSLPPSPFILVAPELGAARICWSSGYSIHPLHPHGR
ncbi:hypothetical protein D9758_012048 [Tetrapyrgos nigripes]|uniref:Uncharacterized protein n=1 Tax=Tetrapyrgos nigripes TaxID=182062 RepID=A0A8H5FJF6_9AGAR|nr:hypothetical protein D9758_012048 [Tetrapyrgos nigripes]